MMRACSYREREERIDGHLACRPGDLGARGRHGSAIECACAQSWISCGRVVAGGVVVGIASWACCGFCESWRSDRAIAFLGESVDGGCMDSEPISVDKLGYRIAGAMQPMGLVGEGRCSCCDRVSVQWISVDTVVHALGMVRSPKGTAAYPRVLCGVEDGAS